MRLPRWLHWLIYVAFWFGFGLVMSARAETVVTGEPNIVTARFITNPASVTVDVKDVGAGTQLANDVPATHETIDGVLSDVWSIDLATLPGYPTDCSQRTYIVRFQPLGADCSAPGSPGLCATHVVDVGGARCRMDPIKDIAYVRTTTAVSAQGISKAVIDYEARRGRAPIRWRRIHFTDRGHVKYEVFYYKDTLGYPHLPCTAETTTNPATMTTNQIQALGASATCSTAN